MDWFSVLVSALASLVASDEVRWAAALGEVDEIRAGAFATGRPELLDQAYAPDSSARDVDAALIGSYEGRGGRVVGADLVVLSCKIVRASADRVTLDIVDRLAEAKVVWADGTTRSLPRDLPTRRVVTLVRTGDDWRIAN